MEQDMKETKVNKQRYYSAIKAVMKDETLTARRIGEKVYTVFGLGAADRNSVQPRLTELVEAGKVERLARNLITTHESMLLATS